MREGKAERETIAEAPATDGGRALASRVGRPAAHGPDLPVRVLLCSYLSVQSTVGGHDDLHATVVLLPVPVDHLVHDIGHGHMCIGVARDQ